MQNQIISTNQINDMLSTEFDNMNGMFKIKNVCLKLAFLNITFLIISYKIIKKFLCNKNKNVY